MSEYSGAQVSEIFTHTHTHTPVILQWLDSNPNPNPDFFVVVFKEKKSKVKLPRGFDGCLFSMPYCVVANALK